MMNSNCQCSFICPVVHVGRNGAPMTVDGRTVNTSDAMARRRVNHQSPSLQTVSRMKARQSAKIREIAEALVCAGFVKLDAQAKVLGLCRSTTWTILK